MLNVVVREKGQNETKDIMSIISSISVIDDAIEALKKGEIISDTTGDVEAEDVLKRFTKYNYSHLFSINKVNIKDKQGRPMFEITRKDGKSHTTPYSTLYFKQYADMSTKSYVTKATSVLFGCITNPSTFISDAESFEKSFLDDANMIAKDIKFVKDVVANSNSRMFSIVAGSTKEDGTFEIQNNETKQKYETFFEEDRNCNLRIHRPRNYKAINEDTDLYKSLAIQYGQELPIIITNPSEAKSAILKWCNKNQKEQKEAYRNNKKYNQILGELKTAYNQFMKELNDFYSKAFNGNTPTLNALLFGLRYYNISKTSDINPFTINNAEEFVSKLQKHSFTCKKSEYNVDVILSKAGTLCINKLEQYDSYQIAKKYGCFDKADGIISSIDVLKQKITNPTEFDIVNSNHYTVESMSGSSGCIILRGTLGEVWTTSPETLVQTYSMPNGVEIDKSSLGTKLKEVNTTGNLFTFNVKTNKDSKEFKCLMIPCNIKYEMDYWGTKIKCNRIDPPSTCYSGDFVILKDDGSIRRIVNGVAFHNTYSLGSQYSLSTTESQIKDDVSKFDSVSKLKDLCKKLKNLEAELDDKIHTEKTIATYQSLSSYFKSLKKENND